MTISVNLSVQIDDDTSISLTSEKTRQFLAGYSTGIKLY